MGKEGRGFTRNDFIKRARKFIQHRKDDPEILMADFALSEFNRIDKWDRDARKLIRETAEMFRKEKSELCGVCGKTDECQCDFQCGLLLEAK